MMDDLLNYILEGLRTKGEVRLKLVLVKRKYNTIKGKVVVEEVDLLVDKVRVRDFGLEVFKGINLDEEWNDVYENQR